MSTAIQQFLAVTALLAGLSIGLMALSGARKAWLRFHKPADFAFSLTAALWILHLLTTTALNFAAVHLSSIPSLSGYAGYAAHVGYQLLVLSVAFFLLTCAGVASVGIYALLVVQAVVGAVTLHWHLWPYWEEGALTYPWSDAIHTPAYQTWIAVNLLLVMTVMGTMAHRLFLTGSYNCWLALAASLMGLGLCLDDLLLAGHAQPFSTLSHSFYATFLLVVWHLVSQPANQIDRESTGAHGFQSNSGFEASQGFGLHSNAAATAVAYERHRIAQDLHDGVGSQIVTILSSLDCQAPQQKAVALALEQCLVDLKMTVDAIDCANDNVLEALGRLRYRVQHSLDKLGISMGWKVEICDALEAVQGAQAHHVLRIAQESLANVMRHSHASIVEVVCRFEPETNLLVLEVRDNGQGLAHGADAKPAGKGLEGMRRRAKEVGGELQILSKTGGSTCIKLTMPLTRSRVWAFPYLLKINTMNTAAVWRDDVKVARVNQRTAG